MKPRNSPILLAGWLILAFYSGIHANAQHLPFAKNNEFLLNTTLAYTETESWEPECSIGNNKVLLVWEDNTRSDISASRVGMDGTLIDKAGITIAHSIDGGNPSVAFDGTNWLVVWDQWGETRNIYGARVDQDGNILDPEGIEICTLAGEQKYPHVAFGGANFLVVWTDVEGEDNIYGKRIGLDGSVLDSQPINICTAANDQGGADLTAGGGLYIVVWHDERSGMSKDIYGTRMNNAGNVLDPNGILIKSTESDQWDPDVAFDGMNYLVVWDQVEETWLSTGIWGARMDPAGTVLDQGGFVISNESASQETPVVTFDGTNYFVGWNDYRQDLAGDIFGARVATDATILDPNGIPIATEAGYAYFIHVDGKDNQIFATWESHNDWITIHGTPIEGSGVVLIPDGEHYAFEAEPERTPAIAFDGSNFMVVWSHYLYADWDIFGTLIDPQGNILPPGIIHICTEDYNQRRPEIAFDGTNYLVVWKDKRNSNDYDIYGSLISTEGIVLNPDGLIIDGFGMETDYPAVAFDGDNFLVVYENESGGVANIRARFVAQDGSMASDIMELHGVDRWQERPEIAFNGNHYLVVWSQDNEAEEFYYMYGFRVAPDGTFLDPEPFQISNIDAWRSAIDVHGTDFMVVWEEYFDDIDDARIYGARVDNDGNVLDPGGFVIASYDGMQLDPDVVWDGEQWLVVWEDGRYDPGTWDEFDIYAARVSTGGVVDNAFAACEQYRSQWQPELAKGAGNYVMMSYYGWTADYEDEWYNCERAWAKRIEGTTGMEETKETNLEIFPVPASDKMYITIPDGFEEGSEMIVWNLAGQTMQVPFNTGPADKTMQLNIKGMEPGVYFIGLYKDNGYKISKFMVY